MFCIVMLVQAVISTKLIQLLSLHRIDDDANLMVPVFDVFLLLKADFQAVKGNVLTIIECDPNDIF